MKSYCTIVTTILALLAFTSPANAKTWDVDYAASKLNFTGSQSGRSFTGQFNHFTAAIDFDPAHPEMGHIAVDVDMTSAEAGNKERNSNLPQADWFDTKQFPAAHFTSTAIRRNADGSFVADGKLAIKGIEKSITLPFTLTPEGDHMRAKGGTDIVRTDFKIGDHDWANEDYVAFAVRVDFDCIATTR